MSNDTYSNAEGYNCETCGTFVPASKKFGSGRFCSRSCANKFSNKFTLTDEVIRKKSIVARNKFQFTYKTKLGDIQLTKNYITHLQEKWSLREIALILGIDSNVFYKLAKLYNIKENPRYINCRKYRLIDVCRNFLHKPLSEGSITFKDTEKVRKECEYLIHHGISSKELCINYLGMSKPSASFLRDVLHIKLLSVTEAVHQYYQKQGCYDNLSDKSKYYKECKFHFPDALIPYIKGSDKFPNYINEKFNPHKNSITKDHRISRIYGFKHNIDPYLISHPANCELMLRNDNASKNRKCSITIDQLIEEVEYWNENIIHKIFNDFK